VEGRSSAQPALDARLRGAAPRTGASRSIELCSDRATIREDSL